jgi:outer membrane protein OmpA-like peptidoglycan-associated protein
MNKLVSRTLILSAISLLSIGSAAFGQNAPLRLIANESISSAPAPAPVIPTPALTATGHGYWGFDLGLTDSWYEGASNFFWPVTDQTKDISTALRFGSSLGSGIGGIFGVKAGFPLSHSLDLEGKLRVLTNYTSNQLTDQQPTVNGEETSVNNNYTALLTNLDLAAILHIALSDQWYAAGGVSFSGLLSNNFYAQQTLPPGVTYVNNDGGVTNGTSETVPSGSQSGLFNTTRLDLQLGGGAVFPVSSFALDAELLVGIPLTAWLQSAKQTGYDNFADMITARNESFGEDNPLAHPTFPNLWYASLTIGIRFPFAAQQPASAEEQQESEATSAPVEKPAIGDDGKVALTGSVTDAKTGEPVDANMTVVDLTNNKVVGNGRTDPNGKYNVRVKAPGKYSVTADADGHLFGTTYFEVDDQGRILAPHPHIKLNSTAAGGRTRLLVFFDFNSADLDSSSYPELDRAVNLMKAVPTMHVQIAGYSDSVGNANYNLTLSAQRANAVRDYIVQDGIDPSRVTGQGYGKASPVADNGTAEGRAENRRVEFVVISK